MMKLLRKFIIVFFSKKTAEAASAFLDIAKEITDKTKNKVDDQVLEYITSYIVWRTKDLSGPIRKEVEDLVNKNKGKVLKDYSVNIGENVGIKTPFGTIEYDLKEKRFEFGRKLSI